MLWYNYLKGLGFIILMNNNIKSNHTTNKILQRDLNILEQYFIIVSLNLQQSHHVHNSFAKACGVLVFKKLWLNLMLW